LVSQNAEKAFQAAGFPLQSFADYSKRIFVANAFSAFCEAIKK
jgi:hypothetical protein